jgi:rubrerythrin
MQALKQENTLHEKTRHEKTGREKNGWTMADVPWEDFDAARVDREQLKIIKAAALVEYNARDYAKYLGNIFHDDAEFAQAIAQWAEEEVQHGLALGRWAEMADPAFNFQESFKRFTAGYRIEHLESAQSVRGSRSGELVARCIVETGTSSYYTALADGTDEPVLKVICRMVAGDEHRHYKLFYDFLGTYLQREKLNKVQRLKVGLSRMAESEDDELAYAYYSANDNQAATYNLKTYSTAYAARAFGYYKNYHIEKIVAMVFKACGLNTQSWLARVAGKLAWATLKAKHKKAVRLDKASI